MEAVETYQEEGLEDVPDDGIYLIWEVPEFEQHDRGPKWYLFAGIIGIALILYALFTANFLFAIIIVMGGIIMFLTSQREPEKVVFAITGSGFFIGDHFHPFHEFENFSILYFPPELKKLYLTSGRRVRPTIAVPLEDIDPNVVRETLLYFLPEDLDRTEESLTELVARVYKL